MTGQSVARARVLCTGGVYTIVKMSLRDEVMRKNPNRMVEAVAVGVIWVSVFHLIIQYGCVSCTSLWWLKTGKLGCRRENCKWILFKIWLWQGLLYSSFWTMSWRMV